MSSTSSKQGKSTKLSSKRKVATSGTRLPLVLDPDSGFFDAETLATQIALNRLHLLEHLDHFRSVMEVTLESLKNEIHEHHPGHLGAGQFIWQAPETLADKTDPRKHKVSVEEGWQELLERGLKSKTSLLKSKEFKSTSEASDLLGIGEHAVRKRIREQKLFALRMSGEGEHRIPAWALDTKVTGAPTEALLAEAGAADEWHLYHFMSTPNGSLNGLRPFECLMSSENLPRSKLASKQELISYLKLPAGVSLLQAVKGALRAELTEGQEA